MYGSLTPRRPGDRPRMLVLGAERDALGTPLALLSDALDAAVETVRVRGRSPRLWGYAAYRDASKVMGYHHIEAVHLADARLAWAGVALKRRFGVPVSASVDAGAVGRSTPAARLIAKGLSRLDQGFVTDDATARLLRRRARRLPLVSTPPVAPEIPAPSERALASMSRRLEGMPPGRLVVAMPWPVEKDYVRWYRDAVAPLLSGNPVCLFLGVPSRRHARLLVGATGMRENYRIHTGALTSDVMSAAARCVDVFLLPAEPREHWLTDDLIMSMIASRVPLVVGGGVRSDLIRHEDNAFAASPGDPMSLVSTLNQLLWLPAVQRHYLGEQFAEHAAQIWAPAASAEVYLERLSALVGRPQIPAELRAA